MMKPLIVITVLLGATLTYARELSGVVRDPSGARIAGAIVKLADDSSAPQVTDSSGEFRFLNVPETLVRLQVTAPGFAGAEVDAPPGTGALELTLEVSPMRETVVVSATRTQLPFEDAPADVRVIGREEMSSNASLLVDEVLRQALGFALFRRSSARATNPTTQGLSLRGVGGSGASRAVVLRDGVPLNDPFGGWVQWSRVPAMSLDDIEVVRGGVSDLYGAGALSGVVSLAPRRPAGNLLNIEMSAGNSAQPDVAGFGSVQFGKWQGTANVETMRMPGYVIVSDAQRGAVDRRSSLDFTSGDVFLGRRLSPSARVFLEGSMFGEERGNGTELQINSTHLGQIAAGADADTQAAGRFALRFYAIGERYHQDFSAVADDRNSELLTRRQVVPARAQGANLQWDKAAGAHHAVGGFEWRGVSGRTNEEVFVGGVPLSTVNAGGRTDTFGWFGEDYVRIGSRLVVSGAVRGDFWSNTQGSSISQPLAPGSVATVHEFADRTEWAVSPRVAARFTVTQALALTASVYRSFRAPTLNELYRAFRVGNVLTLANPDLTAERLTGGETGVAVRTGPIRVRSVFFYARVDDPVANATVSITPDLITRQRQNLGATRARGLEVESEWQWNHVFMTAGYQWTDSTVAENPASPLLVGKMLPQVPAHQFTLSARYQPTRRWTFAAQARGSGRQFDDDRNELPLDGFASLDLFVSRGLTPYLDAMVAVENATGQRYMVGRTPVITYGPPAQVRAGLRISLGAR